MRFTRVKIDNFYNLKDVNLDFTNGNTLIVGPNGSGKTNIIKCIHFLVDVILNQPEGFNREQHYGRPIQSQRVIQHVLLREDTELNIWDPNEDCFIEIHAWFNKAEVELFSELWLLFLLADVHYVVCAITKFLMDQAMAHVRCFEAHQGTPPRSVSENVIKAMLQDKDGLFYDFPETTFRKIIGTLNHQKLLGNTSCRTHILLDDSYVSPLGTDTTKRLLHELLKITRRALSEQDRPVEGSDVVMQARTQKTVDGLDCSLDV